MENIHRPAFPYFSNGEKRDMPGLTKLEYALIHSTWEPSKDDIDREATRDRNKNPHNDSYKPPLRSYDEIVKYLKVKHFTSLLN